MQRHMNDTRSGKIFSPSRNCWTTNAWIPPIAICSVSAALLTQARACLKPGMACKLLHLLDGFGARALPVDVRKDLPTLVLFGALARIASPTNRGDVSPINKASLLALYIA